MNILITPAADLTKEQINTLERDHRLFFIDTELVPLKDQDISFDPEIIDGIICNFFFLHNEAGSLPNLRFVQATSAGLDRIPVDELRKKGVPIFNAQDAYSVPMAEWAVAKTLEILKDSRSFYEKQKEHHWEKKRDIRELAGLHAVICGFGNAGRQIAKRLKAFDVNICSMDIVEDVSGLSDKCIAPEDLKCCIGDADLLYITLPLLEDTYHMIDAGMLELMKDDAVIVNVSRGPVIDQAALYGFLKSGKFAGAALDVFESEPLESDDPYWDLPNVFITPHNSFVGCGNRDRLFKVYCTNIEKLQVK